MADRMLVQGAAQVARAEGVGKLAATTAAMDLADHLSEGVNTVIQARNRHFNSAMKAELAKTGEMTDEEYKKYEKKLRKQRFKYVYLNKRGRMSLENDLNKEADAIKQEKELNDKIANVPIENPSKDLGGCNANAVAKIVKGEMEVVYDENGNAGYNMPAGRECYAAEREELREYVKFDENNNAKIASYANAWDDGRFELSSDGNFKEDKFGNKYPNTKEGYQSFVDASEKYWKEQDKKTQQKRKLDIDTQTQKRSAHPVWEQDNESEFGGSPMTMKSPMKANEMQGGQGQEETKEPKSKANGNFMSFSQVEGMVKGAGVDKASFNAIRAIVADNAIKAENIQLGENNEFNYKKNYNNMKQQIVAKGNLRSLAQNTNPFGRVFIEDLAEAIMTTSYEDLGIASARKDKGKLEAMDPTPKTPINMADAEVIVRSIYNNPKMLTEYVSEYYTNMAEQNFNDNLKPEVAQNFDFKLTQQEALASARKRFGSGKTFTYKGNVYSTNTEQDTAKDEDEFA